MIAQKLVILTRNIKVSDRRKSCGRPNILSWTSALRTSVADVICDGETVGIFEAKTKLSQICKQVEKYLKAYATIMNKQQFRFAYIDAFAGTGYREVIKDVNGEQIPLFQQNEIIEIETYSEGSAHIALQITPEFDEYIFIEKSKKAFQRITKTER